MKRNAFSLVEVTIALVLLSVAATAVGRFTVRVHQGLKDRELSSQLGWEIENARETILSWDPREVTLENIEAIPISERLKTRLDDARWAADLKQITYPVAATQVTLRLTCTLYGQPSEPEVLTFWLGNENMGAKDAP